MKTKKINYLVLVITFSFLIAFFVALLPEKFGICTANQWSCINTYSFYAWWLIIAVPVFGISILCAFLKEEIVKSWLKLAVWFLPVAFLVIAITPTQTQDFITPFDKKFVSFWFSVLFLLVSLILIIYKSLKLRGK